MGCCCNKDRQGSYDLTKESPTMKRILQYASEGKLVIFAGAGISMLPPTSLPSWNSIALAVVQALCLECKNLCSQEMLKKLDRSLQDGIRSRKLPADYVAELLFQRLGDKYFDVMSAVDSDEFNPIHEVLAKLVRSNCVKAIITTNFDCCLEAAANQQGLKLRVLAHENDYAKPEVLPALASPNSTSTQYLLKIHGTAEDRNSVVDTLSQRKIGLSKWKIDCLRALLDGTTGQTISNRSAPSESEVNTHGGCLWLFLGYSGADLAAEPNYLGLQSSPSTAEGFVWLTHESEVPIPPVQELAKKFEEKGVFQPGNLPEWLRPLEELANSKLKESPLRCLSSVPTTDAYLRDANPRVSKHANDWAAKLNSPTLAAICLSDLAVALGDSDTATELLSELLESNSFDKEREGVEVKALLINALAKIINIQGHQERSVSLNQDALHLLEKEEDRNSSIDPARSFLSLEEVLARIYFDLGNAFRTTTQEGSYKKACAMFDRAVAIYAKLLKDPSYAQITSRLSRGILLARMGLADSHRLQTNFSVVGKEQAEAILKSYEEIIAECEKIGDVRNEAIALKNKGIVFKAMSDAIDESENQELLSTLRNSYLNSAKDCYAASLKDLERLGDHEGLVKSTRGLAGTYKKLKNFAEAKKWGLTSLKYAQQCGYRAGEARALRILADIAIQQKESAEALPLLEKSIEIMKEIQDISGQARALELLSEINSKEGNHEEAKMQAARANDLFQAIQEDRNIAKGQKQLKKVQKDDD